ncbi:MAG: hypothetical protein A2V98_20640 [Planctomycetes bacterium RBG_16_64_12]|nr:MAG: hypothetical protein A2V98_20640 [Planctomycetes bacterium RBG_16_64_12]
MSGVLESIVIGSPGEREELESTIAMIDDADLVAWFDRRHDRRRSSCNDIGGRARAIAKQLREAVKRKQSAEISVSPPSSLRTTNHGQNDNRVV